jgi:hypothetical protein
MLYMDLTKYAIPLISIIFAFSFFSKCIHRNLCSVPIFLNQILALSKVLEQYFFHWWPSMIFGILFILHHVFDFCIWWTAARVWNCKCFLSARNPLTNVTCWSAAIAVIQKYKLKIVMTLFFVLFPLQHAGKILMIYQCWFIALVDSDMTPITTCLWHDPAVIFHLCVVVWASSDRWLHGRANTASHKFSGP